MGVYIEFAKSHWVLSLAMLVVLAALAVNEIVIRMRGLSKISTQTLVNLVNREEALVLDLRSVEEFKAGHIAGAKQVDSAKLATKIENLLKDKSHPVILVCAHGQKSLSYAQQVEKLGYQRVYYLAQGMAAWRQDNLPLVK
ncbi:MAG: yibN [Gammaproteobacteria bacterium]|jgi:rhodanese-related sulfurtransferase|nr:yibN [Gammaproteobacteria bacterium]